MEPLASARRKVDELIAALGGLAPTVEVDELIAGALRTEHGEARAWDIAIHLTEWHDQAAFLLALLVGPERFTAEEVRAGLADLMTFAPNHLAAAAHLAGRPVFDIFQVGLRLDG